MKVSKKKLAALFGVALMITITLSSTAYAIKNGTPDKENNWPYVCWIATWDGVSEWVYLCTGSLIAPKVVLCAGHCTVIPGGIQHAWVSFAQEASWSPLDGGADWKVVASWHHHPEFKIGGEKGLTDWITHDVGILILKEAVIMDEYAELPSEGLVDTLPMKQDMDIVGYGVQYQVHGGGPPYWDYIDFGYRYYAHAQLIASNHVMSDEFMRLTANPGQGKGGTCFGDSGSPILLAGTNTVLGVCSWGTNGNCAGVSYEQRIDIPLILDWINDILFLQ
jgi:hypothetical protein